MLDTVFPALIQNAALLLAMAFVYDLTTNRFRLQKPTLPVQLAIGVTLGILSIIIMLSSWRYVTGIVFDTRSVLLGVAGLFFGAVPTVVAMAMAAAFRLSLGGAATVTGVSVILASGTLGLLWRHYRRPATEDLSWRELYLFGVLVHIVMLALMFLLPWATALQVLAQISLPVLLIYPLATAMLGSLMVLRQRRERIVAELQNNEERLRLALMAANQGLYDLNVQTGEAKVSPEYATMLGYDPAEFHETNTKWIERLHPDDHESVATAYRDYITGKTSEYRVEFRQQTKAGDWKWILSLGKVVEYDAAGRPLRMLGTHTNITERKQAEVTLGESERRYRQLYEANPQPMWVYDLETLQFLAVNDAAVAHYGYGREAFLAMTIKDIRPPEEVPRLLDNVERVSVGFDNAGFWRHLKNDGSIIEVEISSHTLIFDGRRAEMVLALDVTARRRAEAALRESEERFRSLLEDVPNIAVQGYNRQRRVVFWNTASETLYGFSREETLGRQLEELIIPPEMRQGVIGAVNSWLNQGPPIPAGELVLQGKGGRPVNVFSSHVMQINIHGEPEMYCLDIDLSERKQNEEEKEKLQAQLLQSQKMELVGRLAGGVAHDFNNMLQTILGYSELSLAKVEPTSPVHEGLLEIRKAAMRSADLTRQLLAFARKQTANPKVLDLNNIVSGMLKMLQRLIGEDIDLAWLPGHSLWPVKIDPSQLDQILANLAVNARDAIADTGKITIETENISLDAAYCADHPESLPGEYVLLVVSDNGCGMYKETLDHIFEPFFTTKEQGKGTGLGLATVYGIVKQNNGFVNVYSEPGQGTTFSIYLPSFASETVTAETSRTKKPAGGTETVLLVEDDAPILNFGKTMLQRLGYAVLAANTPMMAIQLAQEHAGEIHLLITDVVMPEMNGRELVQRLSVLRPGMQCLYMSGYTANVIAHHGVLDPGIHFIQKPFSMDDLGHAIQKTLRDRKEN